MNLFWNIIFWLVPIWTFVLIPFSTFYYEADDGMLMAGTALNPNPIKKSKLASALCYLLMVLIIVGLVFFLTYEFLSTTEIPVRDYNGTRIRDAGTGIQFQTVPTFITVNFTNTTTNITTSATVLANFTRNDLANLDSADVQYFDSVRRDPNLSYIKLQVDVSTFYAGLMAWLGWFLLALFGGIGLAAMPLDLILAFVHRPRHLDAVQFAELQQSLRDRTNELVDIGELIKIERDAKMSSDGTSTITSGRTGMFSTLLDSEKRKEARDEREAILGFKQAVFLLEQDVEEFQACAANYENYNPVWPYMALILGLCSIIITLFWVLHILLFVLPKKPVTPFLNNYFSWFDRWFPLLGVLSVAIFILYLLFAAVKGCFKFGLRIPFFVHLHPMRLGKTYMSSFMFNIGLVLLCSLPVVQFGATAFRDYARYSTILQIYGVQVQHLQFFQYFFDHEVFVYAILVLFLLTCIYLISRPVDRSTSTQFLRDKLKGRRP
jgi:LMBR1 domain-containing protein 1